MVGKLKCVIVDDDANSLGFAKEYVMDSSIAEVTDCFNHPEKFLAAVPGLDFDLAILDISLPGISGFDVARHISGKPVIFVTGYDANFSRAVDFPAIDIISKPFTKERFLFGLEKARRFINARTADLSLDYDLFKVKGNTGLISIKTSEIVFVKADEKERRHKNIILKDGKQFKLLYCTFERLLMYPNDLMRINKSEMVSRSAVYSIESDILTINIPFANNNQKQVTLSKVYRPNLKSHSHPV